MDAGGSALKLNFEVMAAPIVTAHMFTKGVLQQPQLKPDKHSIKRETMLRLTIACFSNLKICRCGLTLRCASRNG